MAAKTDNHLSFIEGSEEHIKSLTSRAPRWLNDVRRENLSRWADLGVPTIKDEDWKYTDITPLFEQRYHLAEKIEPLHHVHLKKYSRHDEINIIFVNGIFYPGLSNYSGPNAAPAGVRISTFEDALKRDDPQIKKLLMEHDDENAPFAALNKALAPNGAFIQIDNKTTLEKLIHIIHITSLTLHEDQKIISSPRSLITLGESSEATIMESHLSFFDELTYFTNALSEIFLGENATLHYCKAQDESRRAFHIGTTHVHQAKNSNFDGFSMTSGGALARNNLNVILDGEGAGTTLNGFYTINGQQHADNHTFIDHRVPHCTSRQFYKGILNDASRAVFNGRILVRPAAQKTNSYQINKNLILGKDCRADAKPQLEIFADDVKCSHGAAIGQINEDELFYLQTRNIARKAAMKMLAWGFANDLLSTLKSPIIRRKLHILCEPTFAQLR